MEVGTETILDKSKSVKSVLMQLFEPSGNTNVEGVDNVNACYGGTNALFNTVNWVESSAWDGRDGLVVAGDIALYKKGNARPTGGAGCVAMLVGPDAPLVLEPGMRGSYIAHRYDFYKPDLASEYPIVDGQYSLRSYAEALDACYEAYNKREAQKSQQVNGASTSSSSSQETPVDRFDHMAFHAPTCKTVQKSYARLLYNDFRADPKNPIFSEVPQELATLDITASRTDKSIEKTFQAIASKRYNARVAPSILAPTQCGNMYCASVYSSLCSLLAEVSASDLQGKRLALFSYGSGLASSFFSLKVNGDVSKMAKAVDLKSRLEKRSVVGPEVYDAMCGLREKAHLQKNFSPEGDVGGILDGVYYLKNVDDMFRREYAIKGTS